MFNFKKLIYFNLIFSIYLEILVLSNLFNFNMSYPPGGYKKYVQYNLIFK
jgi:hypothetical protein